MTLETVYWDGMVWPMGLYGSGMHDFVLREAEIGWRAAVNEDSESTGAGPMLDLEFLAWELCEHDCDPCDDCTARALRILSGAEKMPDEDGA